MNKTKMVVILSVFAILMTVFGSVFAQDNSLPAFRVSSVATDEKVVLTTKNFPADTAYLVSMGSPENPDAYTNVAKFNSKTGGSLNVTVKIPEKFHGLYMINLMLQDDSGAKIPGSFVNDPALAPVEEPEAENTAEEPISLINQESAEEPVSEEPAAEEGAEEPKAEEGADESIAEEGAAEEGTEEAGAPITLINQQPAAEEPAAEEPVIEEKAEEPVAEETVSEESAEEPVAEEPVSEEPILEQPVQPVEEVPAEENAAVSQPEAVCNYALTPTVTIDAVAQNASVTFTTHDFPANSTFSVSMGVYVSSWVPDPKPAPRPYPYPIPQPYIPEGFYPISGGDSATAPSAPSFNPGKEDGKPAPAPAPAGHFVSSFNGTEVGTFSTGDGSSQTLTFQIPAQLAGANPIALWISDLGPCGFYSYNYFWNATWNATTN